MRLLLLITVFLWASAVQADSLWVITSTQVPDATVSVKQLADIYTLKKNFWADNTLVIPVNREASSKEREKYSETVFHLSSQELAEYLDRLRFQGKLPPLIQSSDQAVIAFVRSVPGALGYINPNQALPAGVKILVRLP